MAANSLWCFLVPLVVVLYTVSAASINSEEEFVRPVPLTRASEVERRPKCPSRETWDKCGALCQRNCTNFNEHPGVCPLPCVPGCVCEPGYVRGSNGRCIKSKECPGDKKCPRGERYDECSYLCQKNCTNYNQNVPCTQSCHPGCVCPEGYVRSVFPSGKCIKVEKCRPRTGYDDWPVDGDDDDESEEISSSEDDDESSEDVDLPFWPFGSYCPKNEEFVKCDAKYEPDCGNTPLSKSDCVSGCRCKADYVRGPKGDCIKKDKCPEKDDTKYPVQRICPKFEYWNKFIAHCQKNCTHPKFPACAKVAVEGCVCKRGYLRRDDGKCVPKRQCPKKAEELDQQPPKSFCPKNERYSACLGHCEPNCKNKSVNCDRSLCVSECTCNFGFVRGPKGTCIKAEECPKKDSTKYPVKRVCAPKEHWDTNSAHCQKNCTTLDKQIPCTKKAVAGCVCDKGLYRDKTGQCVPRNECSGGRPDVKTFCPQNEVFIACIGHCEPDCKRAAYKDCDRSLCVSECWCKPGFVRGPKGDCIKKDKCPANDKTKYPVKRKCPPSEQWEPTKAHCQTNCTTIGKKLPCTKKAVAGCICKKDTYRNRNGQCVPKNQCSKKSDEFESFTDSISQEDLYTEEPEWLRGDDNEAEDYTESSTDSISREDLSTEEPSWDHDDDNDAKAKSVCPPNEFFAACIGHCEPDCKNKQKTLQDCDRTICVSECKCQWGFVRGPKGDCIKPDKCPKNDKTKYPVKRKCPAKEQWDTTSAHCQTNCTTIGKKTPCTKQAVAGCVCKKDTYRAKNGECVPKKQCPKKSDNWDSSFEESRESRESREESENLSTEEPSWGDHDEDEAKAKAYCPPNEFFAACIGHCEPDCKNKNKTLQDCPRNICVSECKCQWGFVRGPKGDCIKPDKCPKNDKTKYPVKRKCPAKEQWETSTAHCQTNCTTIGKKLPCPKISVAGCVCKKDTYRAKNGECVPKKQCPKKSDDHDEDSWNRNEDASTESAIVDEEYYEEKEEVLEGPGGCPSDRKCTQYCRSEGKKYGRCVGRHRRRCTCRS